MFCLVIGNSASGNQLFWDLVFEKLEIKQKRRAYLFREQRVVIEASAPINAHNGYDIARDKAKEILFGVIDGYVQTGKF